MKDHGATGATGCLKNIAYGNFSNVARTHFKGVSHTFSFVGTLATVEPVRSRTVLQIMDGLRGVWHGGPFAPTLIYVFFPRTQVSKSEVRWNGKGCAVEVKVAKLTGPCVQGLEVAASRPDSNGHTGHEIRPPGTVEDEQIVGNRNRQDTAGLIGLNIRTNELLVRPRATLPA